MCISASPARFSNTVIYSAEVERPDGVTAHVIGYQNSARSYGPNAMLLPFPAKGRVTRDNLVNGAAFKDILTAYDEAIERLKPVTRGGRRGFLGSAGVLNSKSFDVFESGSYTIVLAEKAAGIGLGLEQVPETRRPNISESFLSGLGQLYKDWPFALCCFEGSLTAPEPLFWHFEPRFPDVLFAPAIDAHDGNPPDPNAMVARDHKIAFASHISGRPVDHELQLRIRQQVPAEHQWLFNAQVAGREINRSTPNGDFVVSVNKVRDSKVDGWLDLEVSPPPQDRLSVWERLQGPSLV